MNLSAEERDAEQEFFACRVCGVACAIAPVPPGRAVCEDHCEDHEYDYDPHRRDKLWETVSWLAKLLILEAETTVMKELLLENDELVSMLKRGDSKAACLSYVNENW
jgi:predicted nucleic acid-binding Zn ribbon protein